MKKLSIATILTMVALLTGCATTAGCKSGSDDDNPVVSPDTIDTMDTTKTEPQLPPFKPYWKQN